MSDGEPASNVVLLFPVASNQYFFLTFFSAQVYGDIRLLQHDQTAVIGLEAIQEALRTGGAGTSEDSFGMNLAWVLRGTEQRVLAIGVAQQPLRGFPWSTSDAE